MHYDHIESHLKAWEEVFSTRSWGRYPPEELVRFMSRRFGAVADKASIKVLELGCGPGANLCFLAREGYGVAGIDGSPTAIRQAGKRLRGDDLAPAGREPDLQVGNFAELPWADNTFDAVIDIEAISTNSSDVIRDTIREVRRVLKLGGSFFGKMFGTETTGYDAALAFEPGTLRAPQDGPCHGQDLAHYFAEAELRARFTDFAELSLDWVKRSDRGGAWTVQEWLVSARK